MISFSAPLANFGGMSGIVYASGFLSPTNLDSAFTLMLTTPSGYTVELPATESALNVEKEAESLPYTFNVQQNYPNPFNPTTTIRYDLLKDSDVRVTVYNMKGDLVDELFNDYQTAGRNSVKWNATNISGEPVSAGAYLYKVQVGNTYEVKRMMYLK